MSEEKRMKRTYRGEIKIDQVNPHPQIHIGVKLPGCSEKHILVTFSLDVIENALAGNTHYISLIERELWYNFKQLCIESKIGV
jgi:hypothetical protein